MSGATHPADLVDLARYPIHRTGSEEERALVEELQAALAAEGVATLPGFLPEATVAGLVEECDALAPLGHHSEVTHTPYLALPEEGWPEGHPRRHEVRASLTAVAYDLVPAASGLRALYEWDVLVRFIGRVLGREPLHRYADPLGALNVAAMYEGDELGWHFDQTDFVVSIAIQASEGGGELQAARRVRRADDERYPEVAAVLAGATDAVATLAMDPGCLILFEGRHSMHRVTPIEGPVPRYVALLAYDTRPDTDSSELLKLVRYGRSTPVGGPR